MRGTATWQRNIQKLLGDEHGRKTEIAKAADMQPQQFSDLINKPNRNPQLRQLERIAKALGVDLADLFRSESSPKRGQHNGAFATASPVLDPIDPGRIEAAIRIALGKILTDILRGITPSEDA